VLWILNLHGYELFYVQGFDIQAQGPWFWIEGIIDIFFYADLVLNFFTAYEVTLISLLSI
jgi:hypothetical protein